MFSYGPMVISISSFDAGIAVVYATVRRQPYSTSPSISTAIISSFPWPSSSALQQYFSGLMQDRTVSAIDYVSNLDSKYHMPAL